MVLCIDLYIISIPHLHHIYGVSICMYIDVYVYEYIYTHTHIYIYIERERERERETYVNPSTDRGGHK